jgi:hypothetical protein
MPRGWLYFGGIATIPESRTSTLSISGNRLFGSYLGKTSEISNTDIVSVTEYFGRNPFLRVTTTEGDYHVGVRTGQYDEVVRVLQQLIGDHFRHSFGHRLNGLFYRKQFSLAQLFNSPRFSLRTLLIVITLVAVALAVVMHVLRN